MQPKHKLQLLEHLSDNKAYIWFWYLKHFQDNPISAFSQQIRQSNFKKWTCIKKGSKPLQRERRTKKKFTSVSDRCSTGMTNSTPSSVGRRLNKVIHQIPVSRTGQINLKVTQTLFLLKSAYMIIALCIKGLWASLCKKVKKKITWRPMPAPPIAGPDSPLACRRWCSRRMWWCCCIKPSASPIVSVSLAKTSVDLQHTFLCLVYHYRLSSIIG